MFKSLLMHKKNLAACNQHESIYAEKPNQRKQPFWYKEQIL